MKLSNIILAVVLIVAIVIGWATLAMKSVEEEPYEIYCDEAKAFFEEGLYQRAILKWEEAYAIKPSEQLYINIHEAYKLRYQETASETRKNYMSFLQSAVNTYPANHSFVDAYLGFYWEDEKYEGVYNCLVGAIKNGYDNDSLRSRLRTVKYMFDIGGTGYISLEQSIDGYYTYYNESGANVITPTVSGLLLSPHEYASLVGTDNVTVVTDEDSRIINGSGIVLGIFEKNVSESGIFSEGLVPAYCEGAYNYYNEFAVMQFGGYEAAGMFQNGFAAVKKEGKWMLVNTSGEKSSDAFDEILLDNAGRYIINNTIIAKKDGKYYLYDAEWSKLADLDCEDIDINTADGLFAVCKDGKWGYMNTSGEMVIEPHYEAAKSFSNCSAAVCKNGLWGFIDVHNNIVIPCQFEDAGYMDSTGNCPVKIKDYTEEEPTISLTPKEDSSVSDESVEDSTVEDENTDDKNTSTEEQVEVVKTPWSFLKLSIGVRRDNL